jgi:hypothetical protein
MKIRYITNDIEDHVDRNLANSLIRAGIAVAVDPQEPDIPIAGTSLQDRQRARLGLTSQPAAVPVWDVVTVARKTKANPHDPMPQELVIQMEILGGQFRWSGNPKHANATIKWDGGQRYLSGFGREVPSEILGRYTALWKKNPEWRGPERPLNFGDSSRDTRKFFDIPWMDEQ